MSKRRIYLLVALLLGGLSYLLGDGTRGNYIELSRHGDFERWTRSPGVLKSLDVRLASSGRNSGYVVTCGYAYAYRGKTWSGDTCDLGTAPLLGEAAAKARAESMLGIEGRARWRPTHHGRFEGWVLDMGELPVTVRHSARDPTASTLTDTEPLPAYLYWLLIVLTAVLCVAAALACLFFLLLAWGADSGDFLDDPHWCELLFREHPKRELRAWARSMRHFRFIRGSGGGMDDHGDRLALVLQADDQQDIESILAALGVTARPLALDPAADGRGYVAFARSPGDDASGPPPAPGTIAIDGVGVVVYRTPGRLELSITDPAKPTEVTQAAVDAARVVEARLAGLADRVIEPPQADKHCVSPVFYPSFWRDDPPPQAATLSPADIEAMAAKKRHRGLVLTGLGVASIFAATYVWRALGWAQPGEAVPVTSLPVAFLYETGGVPLAVGLFLFPGIALLVGAWLTRRAAKRDSRRARRRLRRGR